MTKPENTSSIEQATNRTWDDWVNELDDSGAREMTHKQLASKLYDQLEGKIDKHTWWAQSITVAYEQHIGKRIPGQLVNGLFEIAVSKIITTTRGDLFAKVIEWFESKPTLHDQEPLKPRTSETPKRSTWRADFADGSKFSATVEGVGEKSKLVLAHTAIPTKSEADAWKLFWASVAEELSET